jgi:hypothetical protein
MLLSSIIFNQKMIDHDDARGQIDSCVIPTIIHPSKTQTINIFNSSRHAVHIILRPCIPQEIS